MSVTNKHDDGQVQSALIKAIGEFETPSELEDIKSGLIIETISDTEIISVNGDIISGTCLLETIDEDDEDKEYSISANYTLELGDDGETVNVEYSDLELNE
jgi:hypothetical protein